MNVFIIGTPFETAQALDRKRLNKQIIECKQILDALYDTSRGWANHPCTLQYDGNRDWLYAYLLCLASFKEMDFQAATYWSELAESVKPQFHTPEFIEQMRRRLYTKDPEHYAQWADLGTSDMNWYFVDGEWRYYINGKRIKG